MDQKLEKPLQVSHWVVWVKTCGTKLAYPSKRHRVLSFSGSRRRLRWLGPTTPEGIQEDSHRIFGRRMMLDGDAYFSASQEDVERVYRQLLGKRHVHLHEDSFDVRGRGVVQSAVGAGHVSRLAAYGEGHKEGAALIGDNDHWPGSPTDTSGELIPSQLRHGYLYSFRTRRLFLGLQHLHALGWHVLQEEGSRFVSPLTPMLRIFLSLMNKT